MHLAENNANGRIYIKHFEIEKAAYLFVKQNYPLVNCYLVDCRDNVVTMYIKNPINVDYNLIKEVQEKTLEFLENNIGVYISRIDVEIK